MPAQSLKSRKKPARAIVANQGVKKKFVVMLYDNRTVNRHRWMGRESQGVRDNVRSGTRQKSGRTFGIWPDLLAIKGPQRKTSPDCLPKTQVRAKAQADVYGLMPGQCQKVKPVGAS